MAMTTGQIEEFLDKGHDDALKGGQESDKAEPSK